MDIGLFMNTHGLGATIDDQWYLQGVDAREMQPARIGKQAESLGYHSLWFSDHVLVTVSSESLHLSADPLEGKRAYPERPNMLDGPVVMGGVALTTSRIKLATSVLIAPYRHPLNVARQLATVDVLSEGRLITGVGAGWLEEEFEALGIPYEHRLAMTEECIEVYKRSWTDDVVEFHGEFFDFANVSMDPKPAAKPRPPIIFGGTSNVTARLAARSCDGFYPTFPDPAAEPGRYAKVQDEIRREADRIGRDLSDFSMIGVVSARIDDPGAGPHRLCKGEVGPVLEDLEEFAQEGYSLMILHLECPSATVAEQMEQIDRFGREVIPVAKDLKAAGGWGPTP